MDPSGRKEKKMKNKIKPKEQNSTTNNDQKIEKDKSNGREVVSLVISGIALGISLIVGGNQLFNNQYYKNENENVKNLILYSKVDNEQNIMTITPYTNDFFIIKSIIRLPLDEKDELYSHFLIPENAIPIYILKDQIRKTILQNVTVNDPKGVFLFADGFPVIIESNYACKGRALFNKSLYHVSISSKIVKNRNLSDVEIVVNGILFIKNLDVDIDTKKELSNEYEKHKEYLRNLKS